MSAKGFKIVVCCALLFSIFPHNTPAQEKRTESRASTGEVASLRAKLEQQEAQIAELVDALKRQSALIEEQDRAFVAWRQKMERESKPALAPASMQQSIAAAPVAATGGAGELKTAPAAKAPQSIETGYGKIKFNGLLQGWYAGGTGGFRDTFRVRRSELKLSGEITPYARWTVMIDPSKALGLNNSYTVVNGVPVLADTSVNQASRILQDAFLTLDYNKNIHVNVGQFKIPLSLEGLQSSAALETVERALFASDRARAGTYGDVRDLGVMVHGPLSSSVDYQIGLFNGSGENQNDLDKNDQKAVAGRLTVHPSFLRGLRIGGSGVWGNGSGPARPRRDRVGAELLFKRDAWTIKSEFMSGTDSDLHRQGYYGHVGYRVAPKIETIFRIDTWDPDTRLQSSSTNTRERDFITGVNYYLTENNLKFQANYLRKTFANQLTPSRNLFLVNLQASW